MKNKKISLIIPAYNEEITIAQTIMDFHLVRPELEIIVVNNNSTDDTYNVALKTFNNNNINGRVLQESKKGKANAVRKAFQEIDADIYIMVDGDNTYPAEHLDELINKVESGCDMVIGDRISNGSYTNVIDRKFHVVGNNLMLWLVNFFFNSSLSDILSGYRAFSRRFVKNYPILVSGFELETDMTLFGLFNKFDVQEIPIGYHSRPDGSFSKLNTIYDGTKVIFTFFQIARFYRPLMWFSFVSLAFALLGIATSIPVLVDWFTTGYIYHVPLAILATGLELVSFIFVCIGLILDSISYHERQRTQRALLNFK